VDRLRPEQHEPHDVVENVARPLRHLLPKALTHCRADLVLERLLLGALLLRRRDPWCRHKSRGLGGGGGGGSGRGSITARLRRFRREAALDPHLQRADGIQQALLCTGGIHPEPARLPPSHNHRAEEARREEAAFGRGGGEPGVARQQGLRRHVGAEAIGQRRQCITLHLATVQALPQMLLPFEERGIVEEQQARHETVERWHLQHRLDRRGCDAPTSRREHLAPIGPLHL
jgi:hypothetical protein